MYCQNCKNHAEFICECLEKYCKNHLTIHSESCSVFNIKKIDNINKLKIFSLELSQRINKTSELSRELMLKSQKLIAIIDDLCNKSIIKLNTLKTKYLAILEKKD